MESSELRPQPRPKDHQVALTTIKIVVSDDLPASALELLRAEPGWQIDAKSGRPAAELAAALADADALLVRSATKVTADLLPAAPKLRIVARAGTGVDNIDVAAASARGILVVNAPGANSISVAEHACALMLALARSGSRGRSGDEGRQVGEEAVPRHRAPRQDPRHRRPRAHRPGGGAAGPRLRDAGGRPRSVHLARDRRGHGRRAAVARRGLRGRRLPHAPSAVDGRDAASAERRPLCPDEAGRPDHQYGARRVD